MTKNPSRPKGFKDFMNKDELMDLLIDRGICCEVERMDYNDAKHAMGWASDKTNFKLVQLNPSSFTKCVLPAKKFKHWPIIVGFNENSDGDNMGIVDGLHRCATANYREWTLIWGYAPVDKNNQLFNSYEEFTENEK